MVDGRKARGEQTQKKLFDGLFELVAQHGVQGVTAGMLAKNVGVSTSTIFHHFSSLQALTIAAMQSWFQGFMEELEAYEPQHISLARYLEELGRASFTMTQDGVRARSTMAFLQQGIFDEAYREQLAPMLEQFALRQREVLAKLCGRRPKDPLVMEWSCALAAALDGLALQAFVTKDLHQCAKAWSRISSAAVLVLTGKKA